MKLFRMINNNDLDLSLVKALAREEISIEHVDKAEEADVLVIVEKGKGFGVKLDELQDILKLDKPKVVVCIDGYTGDDKTAVVKPTLVGRKLKIKVSDIAKAVLSVAPPDFEIDDDTDQVEFTDEEDPPVTPPSVTLGDRLAHVLASEIRAEMSIGIKGCKGGVGATTLAACLTHALSELGAVHVEPAGTGQVYYGENGGYFTSCPEAKLAVLDGELRGDVVIAVTDDSITSFNCLKSLLETDVPDIVVVNRMRGGLIDSVFRTEFPQVKHFFTVMDNYKACIDGQEAGKPPTMFSPDMARDIGKLAAKVRELLDL